jgi:hypothetical protein
MARNKMRQKSFPAVMFVWDIPVGKSHPSCSRSPVVTGAIENFRQWGFSPTSKLFLRGTVCLSQVVPLILPHQCSICGINWALWVIIYGESLT